MQLNETFLENVADMATFATTVCADEEMRERFRRTGNHARVLLRHTQTKQVQL